MSAPLLAVDAPFLLYRSFYALPDSITGIDDRPVNALLGATNVLLRLVASRRPRAVVACFGAEAAPYRVRLHPGYHAARPPVPEALAWQFDAAPGLFSALGWQCETAPELEADDLLGALALLEREAGGRTLILTGDRDMYQCVGERTSVLYLRSGSSGVQELDATEVRSRYGVEPSQVPDFIALRGDPSDGLPGAPGIGAKTAAEILTRYGTLEAALRAAAGGRQPGDGVALRPRIAAILREHAEELRRYREIARLQPVELELPPDAPTDLRSGAEAAQRLGLGALARRLRSVRSPEEL
jgi:5'-3' exonuclease